MNKPNPIEIETPVKVIKLETLDQIVTAQGRKCVDGGTATVNGKSTRIYAGLDNNPERAAKVAAWVAEWEIYNAWQASNVPGLAELRKAQDAAYNEDCRYDQQFEKMMEDEQNDGVNPPAAYNKQQTASVLAAQFPRAAVYLKAEGYLQASNDKKYSAGKKAMEIIATGGTIEEAEVTLKNWTTIWD